ncbi:hypothetical protein ESCOCP290M_23490 [Escherichia coli]
MDITPFLHALCAVAAQVLVGLFTGNWAYGAIAGCTFSLRVNTPRQNIAGSKCSGMASE